MATIEILSLSPDDWQAYKALRLEALQNAPEAFSTRYEDARQSADSYWQGRLREAAQAGSGRWLLFARAGGRLVGMIGAYLDQRGDRAEIISVYVAPQARGQGVADALMAAMLAELARLPGVQKALLTVSGGSPRAMAFYRRMGFSVTGEQCAVLGDGKTYTEYEMEKNLREQEGAQ